MYEKVNPSHPDKLADRIAGAIVDMAYATQERPRMAAEVLIGHGGCHVICESGARIDEDEIREAVRRVTGTDDWRLEVDHAEQDAHLADNQGEGYRCGDNGIFLGMPVTGEQHWLAWLAERLHKTFPTDGKLVLDGDRLVVCQSNAASEDVERVCRQLARGTWRPVNVETNPLGEWTGGTDVDTGGTNRKLGSDMGDAVTGGGIHGKDLSKADVTLNICCHLLAQEHGCPVACSCAIGDDEVTFRLERGKPITMTYPEAVHTAEEYVRGLGGFERLAEWGLIR